MKIEPRGKYPGVKVHLEPDEVEMFLAYAKANDIKVTSVEVMTIPRFSAKLGKKISKLIEEHPNLLSPRTEDEIKAELVNEFESSKQKLEALSHGKDWTKVKVEKVVG